MTDNESPKLEAVANLSPVSPRPLHNTYTLPQVLPELQDRAEDPDVVPLEPSTFRTAAAAMAPNPDPPQQGLDAAAVEWSPDSDGNDAQSRDASIADDDSFDAYDEDGSGQGQEHPQQGETAGLEPENDDYARTFDSPKEQADVADEEGESQQPQHEDVTKTPESMNISEQLAGVPEQSAAQIVSADPTAPGVPAPASQPSSHAADPAQDALVPPESDHQPAPAPAVQEALLHVSASDPASLPQQSQQSQQSMPSPDPDKVDPDKLDKAAPSEEQPGVQPEDVDMNTGGDSDATAIDIQKLVDEITAKAEAEASSELPPAKPSDPLQTQSPPSMDVDLPSLPPKPALTQEQSQQTYSQATYHHGSLPNAPPFSSAPAATPSQPAYSATNGAPGAHMSQPPAYNPTPPFASYPNAYPPGTGTAPSQAPANNGPGLQQTYDEFLADERKHMSEAKWERFPDGSRIFIGNLSQERVSKRDVFELFHQYGRLAQISLKSAYGFVQYHTNTDAQAAMNALQGAEVKGRKINLEVSKTQKSKKDRDHSPDRKNRDRGGKGADRRRSPSPYGRSRQGSDNLDIPRRYGNDVPDVQILLMQDVHKDFVEWVQRAFLDARLRVTAMFLNPRFPRDAVIQRQVLEGVHAVVELDMRAQTTAKIPLQVFDRSLGSSVSFDQYQDLDPPVAAQLVRRRKESFASQPSYPPQASYPPQPYGTPAP
ncbi:putative rna-binding protein [Diaporthe ampelina]|uniref:Putative rna-binding protein n=1 Tax=Diaporthe ampelina TaxID=1214573 RepID=A0A0G2F8C5_9PEZI|nr:putative rna-binding protein [Diaporthe ampelina]